jgi:uncharacterized membrane protein YgaE (UPF0421/DUF939 family)
MPKPTQLPLTWPPPAPRDLPWELALKMGVSAGVGLFVAHLLDLDFPVYVLLSVATIATTQIRGSWLLAGYRLIGTLIGVPLAILVVDRWSVTPLSTGVVVAAIVVICAGLGMRDSTRLAVLVFAVGITEFTSEIGTWAKGRLVATLIGAAVTLVVCAVPMPHPALRDRRAVEADVPRGFIVGQE